MKWIIWQYSCNESSVYWKEDKTGWIVVMNCPQFPKILHPLILFKNKTKQNTNKQNQMCGATCIESKIKTKLINTQVSHFIFDNLHLPNEEENNKWNVCKAILIRIEILTARCSYYTDILFTSISYMFNWLTS